MRRYLIQLSMYLYEERYESSITSSFAKLNVKEIDGSSVLNYLPNFKIARVTAIFKSGNSPSANNHRPISILSSLLTYLSNVLNRESYNTLQLTKFFS